MTLVLILSIHIYMCCIRLRQFRFFIFFHVDPILRNMDLFEEWINSKQNERMTKVSDKIRLILYYGESGENTEKYIQKKVASSA